MSNSPRSAAACILWHQAPSFGGQAKVRQTRTNNLPDAKTSETGTPVTAVIKPNEPQELITIASTITAATQPTVPDAIEAIKEDDNETYLLDTNRPTKDLRADQETMLYRINPQPHSIRFNTPSGFTLANLLGNRSSDIPKPIYTGQHLTDAEIHFSSASVTGLPALGQTTVLANRALKNMKAGLSTIVLSNSKWQRHNIAQAMIDFTTQADRMSLTQRIIIINNEKDLAKIQSSSIDKVGVTYIVSTDMLKDFYSDNDDFQQLAGVLSLADLQPKQKSKHLKLGDHLPIDNVSEILVDDVHEYTGYSRDGYTKILLSLLRETNSNEKNRSTLIGFSSTPYNRENKGKHPPYNTFIDYETFFPPLSQIKILSTHQESIEQKLIKSITPNQIKLTGADSSGQPIESAIRGTNRNSLLKTTETVNEPILISPDSVNAQIIKQIKAHYQPGQKWRIIASSAEHAKLLGKLLTANIPQANPKVIVGEFKGSYKVNSDETVAKNVPIYDSSAQKSLIALKEQREDEIGILGSFESNSRTNQCDILIDLQILQGYHPSNVTHVVHANFSESETALLRSLGHAYRGDSDQTSIEYWFLDPAQYARYLDYRKGNVNLADRSKTNSAPSFKGAVSSGEATTVESQINAGEALLTHEYWTQVDLHNLVNSKYPSAESFEQGLDCLATDFFNYKYDASKSKDDIKKVISGKHIDQGLFREFLNWAKINLAHVYVYAPELVGITNRQEAKETFKFAFQEMMNGGLPKEINNWHWYDYLDKHLGIVPALPREHALNLRAKKFAEIIYDKFGPKYFEDRAFIRHVIEVFSGVKTDTKLIGLLINSIPKMDMEEAMTLFPELTGYVAYMPFEKLQNMLITKYPNGPSLDLDTFFKQAIYDDLGISFATLVNSISDYHRGSEQAIVNNSVKEQIAEYLTSMKATEHLHEITQQVLYNQILAKVWGINRATVITDNDFRHLVHPHRIESMVHPESPVEQAIDLENVNLDWVTYIDEAIKSKFPANELSSNLKTRLAFAINKFINEAEHHFDESSGDSKSLEQGIDTRSAFRKHQAGSTINKANNVRAIKILSGAISADELTNDDKKSLRTFAHSLDIDLEDLICKHSSFVGIINAQEATFAVKDALTQIDQTKFDPRLAELTNNATTNPELIAEFLFTRDPDALLDRESLSTAIRLINGEEALFTENKSKAASQAYLRSFVSFLEKDKPALNVTVSNLVTELPKLMNILDKDELVATIKHRRSASADDPNNPNNALAKTNKSPSATKTFVTQLGNEIGKTNEEMQALAGLNPVAEHYASPQNQYIQYLKTNTSLVSQIDKIKEAFNTPETLQARRLLNLVWPETYNPTLSHTIITTETGKQRQEIEIKIQANQVSFTEQMLDKDKKGTITKETILDQKVYEFKNNTWQVDESQSVSEFDSLFNLKWYALLNHAGSPEWQARCNQAWQNSGPLSKECRNFIASQKHDYDPKKIEQLLRIMLGDEAQFKAPLDTATIQANQVLFRDWVNFFRKRVTNKEHLELNSVIAAHPKLTGVKNKEELKAVIDHKYPNKQLFQMHETRLDRSTDHAKNTQAIVEAIQNHTGLTINELLAILSLEEAPGKLHSLVTALLDGTPLRNIRIPFANMLIIKSLWGDDAPSQVYTVKLSNQTTLFISPDFIQRLSPIEGKSEMKIMTYKINDELESISPVDPMMSFAKLTDIVFRTTLNKMNRSNTPATSSWLDLIDSVTIWGDGVLPLTRAIIIRDFIRDKCQDIYNTDGNFNIAQATNISIALNGEREYKGEADPIRIQADQNLRVRFLEYINAKREKLQKPTIDIKEYQATPNGRTLLGEAQSTAEIAINAIRNKTREHWLILINGSNHTTMGNGDKPIVNNFKQAMQDLAKEVHKPEIANLSHQDILDTLGLPVSHFTETLPQGFALLERKINHTSGKVPLNIDTLKIYTIMNKIFEKVSRKIYEHYKLGDYTVHTNGVNRCELTFGNDLNNTLHTIELQNGEWNFVNTKSIATKPVISSVLGEVAITIPDSEPNNDPTEEFTQLAQKVHKTFPDWEAVKKAFPNLSDPNQVNETTYRAIIDKVLEITQCDQEKLARLALIPNNLSQRYNHAIKLAINELKIPLANVNDQEQNFQRIHLLEKLWPEARKDLRLLAKINETSTEEEYLAVLAHNKIEVSRRDLSNAEIPRVLGYTIHRFNTNTNKWRTTTTDRLENSIKTIFNIWNKSGLIKPNNAVLQTYRDALNITGEEVGSDMDLVILLADFLKVQFPDRMEVFEREGATDQAIVQATGLIDDALRIITKASSRLKDSQLGQNFMNEFIAYAITRYPLSQAILEKIPSMD